jgi:hypothetical protein
MAPTPRIPVAAPGAAGQEATAALEEARAAVESFNPYHSMAHLTLADFKLNDPSAEYLTGSAKPSGGWLHAPAHLEMFRAAQQRLAKLAERRDLKTRKVTRIRASLLKNSTLVLLLPAEDDDLAAIQVNQYKKSAVWINLITLLGPEQLALHTGIKRRYNIEFAPADCPLGPCLMFDLANPVMTKGDARSKAAG